MKKLLLLSVMIVTMLTLAACGNAIDEGPQNSAFHGEDHITNYSGLAKYDEMDTMYILYIYAVWCGACAIITQDVLDFIEDNEDVPVVFAHEGANGTPPANWGAYPTMMVIQNGEVLSEPYVGVPDILALLESISAGTYNPE